MLRKRRSRVLGFTAATGPVGPVEILSSRTVPFLRCPHIITFTSSLTGVFNGNPFFLSQSEPHIFKHGLMAGKKQRRRGRGRGSRGSGPDRGGGRGGGGFGRGRGRGLGYSEIGEIDDDFAIPFCTSNPSGYILKLHDRRRQHAQKN